MPSAPVIHLKPNDTYPSWYYNYRFKDGPEGKAQFKFKVNRIWEKSHFRLVRWAIEKAKATDMQFHFSEVALEQSHALALHDYSEKLSQAFSLTLWTRAVNPLVVN